MLRRVNGFWTDLSPTLSPDHSRDVRGSPARIVGGIDAPILS